MIGLFTPTEAGGVGAFAVALLCFVKREINWQRDRQIDHRNPAGFLYGSGSHPRFDHIRTFYCSDEDSHGCSRLDCRFAS